MSLHLRRRDRREDGLPARVIPHPTRDIVTAIPSKAGKDHDTGEALLSLAPGSSKATARLLAAASHDLRQPLQAIGLWVELLRMQAEGLETRRILGKIHETARGLERVVNSLLDISKLDLGAVEIQVAEFPVRELLERISATFGPMARERNLAFAVRDSAATVRSDSLLLERVLSNFVSNAIRYCERGGVLVGCRRRGDYLSLEVWDTGAGIPQDRQADIFEEFVQLSAEGKDRARGVGLGLSIAKRIAAMLNHPIHVASRVDRGSCFRVQVPLVTMRDRGVLQARPKDDTASAIYGAFVVFIDDEKELREAMQLLLGKWGCHSVVAASATEAMAELSHHLRTPDCIVIDYNLGDGNTGLRAIQDMRSALGDGVGAIIMTGERRAFVDEALAVSGIPLLRKPIDPDALRLHLATWCLNRARALQPHKGANIPLEPQAEAMRSDDSLRTGGDVQRA